jgi:hypothetical protein
MVRPRLFQPFNIYCAFPYPGGGGEDLVYIQEMLIWNVSQGTDKHD